MHVKFADSLTEKDERRPSSNTMGSSPGNGSAAGTGQLSRSIGGLSPRSGPPTKGIKNKNGVSGVAKFASEAASAAVAVVADIPGKSRSQGSSSTQDGRKLRGIFYQQSRTVMIDEAQSEKTGRRGDFRQRLDVMLSSEERAQTIAKELYGHLKGDLHRLPGLQHLIQDRWNFPERVFPLLTTQLRRVAGISRDQQFIQEADWVLAFVRWLQVLRARMGRTKVSRKRLIPKHTDEDMAKLYTLGAKLGEGSFGEVYCAEHATLGARRVIKSMSKAQLALVDEQVETEVDTMRSLDHPHIVRIFEAFETESRLHIVMDYAAGGDLSDAIRAAQDGRCTLPEVWSRFAGEQIASALEYMHSKGVIHCDLKPGNTMLLHPFVLAEAEASEPHVLVADFGLAEIFEQRQGSGQVKGSPLYLAPEGFEGLLSQRSDMWALGVMLFEMLLGRRPFRGSSNLFTLFCEVANSDVPLDGMPAYAQEIVGALMSKDPKARPSAKECLRYAWFSYIKASVSDAVRSRASGRITRLGHVSYFHRATLFCVAAGLGMHDMADMYEVFTVMDQSKVGYLSLEDLRNGLQRLRIQQDPEILMNILDLDLDGEISFSEFLAAALRLDTASSERHLRYAFEVFDSDHDGHLDMHELRLMLSGDGPLADVLPDGHTVEEVMEDVSGGEGRISFADFKGYLERTESDNTGLFDPTASSGTDRQRSSTKGSAEATVQKVGTVDEARAAALIAELFQDPKTGSSSVNEWNNGAEGKGQATSEEAAKFPTFLDWMSELYIDAQAGAQLSRFLRFQNPRNEADYVAHYLPRTCQQLSLPAVALVVYSLWALLTEDFVFDPSLARWDSPPRVTNNLAWISLLLMGIFVIAACWLRILNKCFVSIGAQLFEQCLCCWLCLVPLVSCFFANRHRCAAMFGYEAMDVFKSINSDYDLIVVMLGALMFLSMRTELRLALAVPVAVSSVVAYALSSLLFGTPYTECTTERNWAWPMMLMLMVSTLGLSGHRSVERRRRLTFLSLEASYQVLKELHDDPGKFEDWKAPAAAAETRTARLKQALDLIRRLSASADTGSKPLKMALSSLVEVLEHTREDIAHADRLLTVDMQETLEKLNIGGAAGDLLLQLLEAPPRKESAFAIAAPVAAWQQGGGIAGPTAGVHSEVWGWNVLPSRSQQQSSLRPLQGAASELIVNAAVAAGSREDLDDQHRVRVATGRLIDDLLLTYSEATSPAAESRAALAVLSAHWLAQSTGLWGALLPWDRFALLVSAAGLHSEVAGPGGGALLSSDPLLAPASSTARTLGAIERSGFDRPASSADPDRAEDGAPDGAEGGALASTSSEGLQDIVRRLMSRSRPRCALEDARRVRVALEQDDQASSEERAAICGLVLAAADLAFLALPAVLHQPWAELCQREGIDIREGIADVSRSCLGDPSVPLDAAAWLRGLIEALALPIYETLAKLDGCEKAFAQPVQNLRSNAKHWKVTPLAVPACGPTSPAAAVTLTVHGEVTTSSLDVTPLRAAAAAGGAPASPPPKWAARVAVPDHPHADDMVESVTTLDDRSPLLGGGGEGGGGPCGAAGVGPRDRGDTVTHASGGAGAAGDAGWLPDGAAELLRSELLAVGGLNDEDFGGGTLMLGSASPLPVARGTTITIRTEGDASHTAEEEDILAGTLAISCLPGASHYSSPSDAVEEPVESEEAGVRDVPGSVWSPTQAALPGHIVDMEDLGATLPPDVAATLPPPAASCCSASTMATTE